MTTTTTPQVLLPGQHAAPPGPVDLTSMYVLHHAFRRDLAGFRTAVARAPLDDRDRWRALARRWQLFATALHHHHAAEDAGLWPLLAARLGADADAREVLDAMQAEHARIDPLLDECGDAFARQAERPDEGVRAALRRSIDDAWELLDGHLGHEERDAMALLQRHLTDADWRRVEREHFRPAYSPREVVAVLPWTMAGLPDDVRRRLLAAGGPAVALLWRLTRRGFARRSAAAFGPPAVRQPDLGQVRTAEGPLDLSAVYVVHHGLRRDLRDLALAVPATPVDDAAAWAALARRWRGLAAALHHHQRVEDGSVWPAIRHRVDPAALRTLDAMAAEHTALSPLVGAAADGFTAMRARPDVATRGRLAEAVVRVRDAVLDHLAHEETDALPLVQQHLSVAGWAAVGRAAAREYGVRDLGFAVPWSALGIPPDQFDRAFAHGGRTVRVLLALTRRRFAREHRTAFGHLAQGDPSHPRP